MSRLMTIKSASPQESVSFFGLPQASHSHSGGIMNTSCLQQLKGLDFDYILSVGPFSFKTIIETQ